MSSGENPLRHVLTGAVLCVVIGCDCDYCCYGYFRCGYGRYSLHRTYWVVTITVTDNGLVGVTLVATTASANTSYQKGYASRSGLPSSVIG
jgi:hypothetical protein